MTSGAAAATARAAIDADALVSRLFRAEAASLVRMARLFTDDRNAAEDIVQEAFIRLHRSADRIRDIDRAAAYLRSIVLNLARDHNRRGLMSLRHTSTMRREEDTGFEEDAVAAADQEAILQALRELPGRQRDCLVLRFYLELSTQEIAETMGISPNSVKTHCRRGLRALAPVLEEV